MMMLDEVEQSRFIRGRREVGEGEGEERRDVKTTICQII